MFIHIGNGNVIRSDEVIGIMDYHTVQSSIIMAEMMKAWKEEKKIIGTVSEAKSVMITNDYIYYSTVSVATLKKRGSMFSTISNLDDDFSEELFE